VAPERSERSSRIQTDMRMQILAFSYLPCAEMDDQVEGLGCFMLTLF